MERAELPTTAASGARRAFAGLRQRWQGLPARERAALALGGAVVAALAAWAGFVGPAWKTLREGPARLARLEASLAEMHGLAREAAELRGLPAVSEAAARDALQAATARLGPSARLQWQGERAVLQLERVSPPLLADWMAEVRAGARLQAVQAQLRREGESLSGTVTLAGPARP